MKKLLLILNLFFAFPHYAMSKEFPSHFEIEKQLSAFVEQSLKGDVSAAINLLPPSLMRFMAQKVQSTPEEFKIRLIEQAGNLMSEFQLLEYQYDLTAFTPNQSEEGRLYGFIPTVTKMKLNSGKEAEIKGYLLALTEENKWYFINWNEKYRSIIPLIFPDLTSLSTP